MNEFWSLTPREVQLTIRAASEGRLDRYDEQIGSAWQGALWSQIGPRKMPKLERVLARRARRRTTFEDEIRKWETFFGSIASGTQSKES